MGLADVHAHLTHPRLVAGVEAVLARAAAAGVTTVIANGLNLADNRAVAALAARYPQVRPAFGLYPVDAVLAELRELGRDYPREDDGTGGAEETLAWLESHAADALAIGEVGLDGHWVPASLWARQEAVFRRCVRLALDTDRPLIVHSRRREGRTLEILQEAGARRVLWHCFGGKLALARRIAERGHVFSIPANARRSESFTRMLQTLPRDQLLLETDCPYLAPDRDGTSEPAHVAATAEYAAELWAVSRREVEERLAETFTRLFGTAP